MDDRCFRRWQLLVQVKKQLPRTCWTMAIGQPPVCQHASGGLWGQCAFAARDCAAAHAPCPGPGGFPLHWAGRGKESCHSSPAATVATAGESEWPSARSGHPGSPNGTVYRKPILEAGRQVPCNPWQSLCSCSTLCTEAWLPGGRGVGNWLGPTDPQPQLCHQLFWSHDLFLPDT